ncbi:hypothetical protein BV20DRAFT_165857 [Pilatotrama ljubarskyi]|nr:hypothetical protein BV20DRAFT_165857 [Pilatotrama ljubarskyi]
MLPHTRTAHNPIRYECPHPGCNQVCRNASGLTQHFNSAHALLRTLYPSVPPAETAFGLPSAVDNVGRNNSRTSSPSGSQAADGGDRGFNAAELQEPPPPALIHLTRPGTQIVKHPHLTGCPCDIHGIPLPPGAPPPLHSTQGPNDWFPFRDRIEFETAEFLYKRVQMSQPKIDTLMDLWAASLVQFGGTPPFASHRDMGCVIDSIPHGDVPWESFTVTYNGPLPSTGVVPPWMTQEYEIHFRDPRLATIWMLRNPDFNGEFNVTPYREYNEDGEREYTNLMSADWAWRQADIVAEDPSTHGAMFVPISLGSDKTTVSVATGQNEYYPLYLLSGNVLNSVRRAHRNAVVPVAFLAIPKTERKYNDSAPFRKFRRQLFHTSISTVLSSLRPGMTTPEVVQCPDAHYRRAIYGLAPYIADYPEQVLASCIVQGWCPTCLTPSTNLDAHILCGRRTQELTDLLVASLDPGILWRDYGIVADVIPFTSDFPRADIHELLSGDILHQVIKGTFKDHLVTWVEEYLKFMHGDVQGKTILDEIDRRIAATPPFPGLRRFKDGRDFKQWTGDDSKGLMKVYLPAIAGLVPPDIVRAMRAFLEFCYIVRGARHTEKTLARMRDALKRFHLYRKVFEDNVRPTGFSLPRQHSLEHFEMHIRNFGSPCGLCSSITESKHIKAVKEPWRRSNRYEAIGQMLITNQRLDKLAAARADFEARGMLQGTCLSAVMTAYQAALALLPVHGDAEPADAASQGRPMAALTADALQGQAAASSTGENSESGNVEPGLAEAKNGDEDPDSGIVEGPRVDASVTLARRPQPRYPRTVDGLAAHFNMGAFPRLVARFLHNQRHPDLPLDDDMGEAAVCPITSPIHVFHSAVALYYAPTDPSGIGGMRRERIRGTPSWHNGPARYDCIFVDKGTLEEGLKGLLIARVRLFFSFKHEGQLYPCALVHWFSTVGEAPDEDTGMWIVTPDFLENGTPSYDVIHVDTILRGAHLIGRIGDTWLPQGFLPSDSLDAFCAFYVNKYADYHAFELAS